jgi:hypothetical protein
MAIFYDDGNAKNSFNYGMIKKLNPNSQWANHSYNHLVLKHIYSNSPDTREKIQAAKELEIADRKMAFWARQPGFLQAEADWWMKEIYRM